MAVLVSYVTVQDACSYAHLNVHIFNTHKHLRLSPFPTSPFEIPCTCSKQSREKLIVCHELQSSGLSLLPILRKGKNDFVKLVIVSQVTCFSGVLLCVCSY